eukprot:scaffold8877_cov112-Isochrysis_galbana.AAC.14
MKWPWPTEKERQYLWARMRMIPSSCVPHGMPETQGGRATQRGGAQVRGGNFGLHECEQPMLSGVRKAARAVR